MGVSGQRHAPATLLPWKRSLGALGIGDWVGPRAGLDHVPAGNKTPAVQHAARLYTD
jgi:N-acetyl-anhydromuramyl-L-alanine amidase AmpD